MLPLPLNPQLLRSLPPSAFTPNSVAQSTCAALESCTLELSNGMCEVEGTDCVASSTFCTVQV